MAGEDKVKPTKANKKKAKEAMDYVRDNFDWRLKVIEHKKELWVCFECNEIKDGKAIPPYSYMRIKKVKL